MSEDTSTKPRYWTQPRYWPTYLAIAGMRVSAWLPWRVKLGLGRLTGLAAWRFAKRRRQITETNIRLCFPELDEAAQARLVKDSFMANGIGIFETATGWCRDPEHLRHRVTFKGQQHMARVEEAGKGALIIGIHFSTLDLGGALHSLFFPADVVYRPHDNPVFERFMTRARNGIFGTAIDRHDLRGVVRRIKTGHHVWYSPDQDFGRDASVFAPFFGVEAASIKLTAKIAKMTGAPVMPLIFHRNPDDRTYSLEYLPPLDNFPSGDEVADAARINQVIEQAIRRHPEQYLWMHRRFKTRPRGEAKIY
ncbi:LpxL/LpxP family Kdo(2)-lipid IV(A) lauroyl/palmitoleoyl acyltransferase [Halomonas denitrificans]|uniref:LpxL/LpxP family Kdo(2)-lipid IV(A) lauroyl/palmitoleoyl acyltransferase n=1 Tax=Halomonas TaxID=2745 RepID=UPI001A90C98E|nr:MULTISPECIES: LpxL/LpxP family Kdo(2)-lipid IV(A) lauroyl/palmitoleoyl acyltransferase [Halomonas]MED5294819.1 LpxL/LpxP family Kdo(2)-lipid IV(A) lauroyl/palmitoleoyl acyltransferase [Pseudomonadota bacterium]MBN8412218.1 LpxL/LpxP family Kdo(2)-lipid IV(A) lauroyl/palmitoleoyl acyltransferase [Halomonas litopenaei]MBY5924494.1 LpxL/LpxP family Kdo(2)-lipid IV(A) lauroyl/palmitoleoyl acyltransferase [Halomonas sp. DP4Y7-2]MBY5929795.1 LpxL/LpxP family Kdo(2)-lipid IV(A) lauroyl/palmitoleoyl